MPSPMTETIRKPLLRMPSWAFVPVMTALSVIVVLPLVPVASLLVRAGVDLPGPLAGVQSLVAQLLFAVFVVPPLETAIAQWIPIGICRNHFRLSHTITVLVSATVFGLLHMYSAFYVVMTFLVGVVLAAAYLLAESRRESPLWAVTAIHALRNALVLARPELPCRAGTGALAAMLQTEYSLPKGETVAWVCLTGPEVTGESPRLPTRSISHDH